MKITHTTQDVEKYKGDMITYFVHQQGKRVPVCDNKLVQDTIKLAFKAGDFSGKEGETVLFYPSGKGKLQDSIGSYQYEGELALFNEDQEKISNSIYFSYIVKKDEDGNSIQDPNGVETVMEINQVDVVDEIKVLPVMNVVVIIVLFIALVLVLIFVFRGFK